MSLPSRMLRAIGPAAAIGFVLALAACRGPRHASVPPPQRHLSLEIVGNHAISTLRLEEVARGEIARSGVRAPDKAAIDDAAYAIEVFYRNEGFSFVEVGYEFSPGEDGARAVFELTEGVRTRLDGIRLIGNANVDTETLMELFDLDDEGYLVEGKVRDGASAILDYYRARGYQRATVSAPDTAFRDDDRHAEVTLTIFEGPAFVLREVEIEGGDEARDKEQQEIVAGALGRTYLPRVAEEIRVQLLELYARHAHPEAQVTVEPRLDEETGDVRLDYRVEPGERVTIAGIRVSGDSTTSEARILKCIPLQPGDAYDARKIREAFDELYSLGVFDSVRIELAPGPGEERELVVQVVESPSLEFYIEPGWGSYEGPRIRSGIKEINLFGTGFKVNLESVLSPLAQGVRLAVTDPRFFDTRVSAETSVFWNRREEPTFTTSEVGFALDLRRVWSRTVTTSGGYSLRSTKLDDVDGSSAVPPEFLDDVDIGSIGTSLIIDTRDSVFVPTRGTRWQFRLEWASALLASQLDYVKGTAGTTHLHPFNERTVLASTAVTTVIVPTENTDAIPLQSRLFNGGENSVRSFKESELGPKDSDDDPVGGEVRNVLSTELRRRLWGNLSGACFFDMGNVELLHEDYFRFQGFQSGIGVGLRYLLPIGPLRLDLAANPNPRDDEDTWVLHFAVGWPF